MEPTVDERMLKAAREVETVVRTQAEETERRRRPTRQVMEALAGAGLFRLLTPRSLGGLEVDPLTCARVIEEVSSYDSAAGWTLMTGNSGDWWAARLPDEGAEELYAESPDAIGAAAFHPPIEAVEVDGGYRMTGRAPLASNVHDATWVLFTAVVMEDARPKMVDGQPQAIALIARAEETEIIDTWYTLGMRGTDSNDVAVDDVFVPARRCFALQPEFEPGSHYQGPLYRFPAMGEAGMVLPPVMLAIARAALDEFTGLAQAKTPFGSATALRNRPTDQATLGRAEATLRSARGLLYDSLSEAWDRTLAGEQATLRHKADLILAGTHAVAASVQAVEAVYGLAGTSAIYTRSPLERHFRDVHTLRHHGFLSASRYETAGQIYLGVPPEFGFVAF